jgi:hypothetical protein
MLPSKMLVPRSQCIYERCRAVNLCKRAHCVGAELAKENIFLGEADEVQLRVRKEQAAIPQEALK